MGGGGENPRFAEFCISYEKEILVHTKETSNADGVHLKIAERPKFQTAGQNRLILSLCFWKTLKKKI